MKSKFGCKKSVAMICIFALVVAVAMETSILEVQAHPKVAASYGWYVVDICHYGQIVDVRLIYGYSTIIEPHDPDGSHQMITIYFNTYYFNYLTDCTPTSGEV